MALTVAVVDGLGGGLGAQIVEHLVARRDKNLHILALGASATATARMVAAGADKGASGENAIRVSVAQADFIMGPIGIILPDAMMGEITTTMVQAILGAKAKKILIPLAQGHIVLVGLSSKPLAELIGDAVKLVLGEV